MANPPLFIRQLPYRSESFPFQPATLLAPMEGVTNIVIRDALNDLGGIGLLCTEFVRVSDHAVSRKTVNAAVRKSAGTPLSVQIMGNNSQLMADSAAKMALAGADVIDINLGCPTKNAIKGNVGAAMLRDPQLLYDVLISMRKKVKGWLSAKIRAGFDESKHVATIAQAVEAAGADFIAVHPRRRQDFYKGTADWRIIAYLKSILKIPVIGNGDIVYPQDALRMLAETGCDAVMIGRGALRNPWIFKQIAGLQTGTQVRPSQDEVRHFFINLKDRFNDHFGGKENATLARLKEFMQYFSRLFDNGIEFRKQILRSQTLDEFMTRLMLNINSYETHEINFFA